jgi:hypothetical protein
MTAVRAGSAPAFFQKNRAGDLSPALCFALYPPSPYGFGTLLIVFKITDTIWYGSPCEFGRRSSR